MVAKSMWQKERRTCEFLNLSHTTPMLCFNKEKSQDMFGRVRYGEVEGGASVGPSRVIPSP
jgi:hypothetical protein